MSKNTMVLFKSAKDAAELMKVLDTLNVKYSAVEVTTSTVTETLLQCADMWRDKCFELAKQVDALERGV